MRRNAGTPSRRSGNKKREEKGVMRVLAIMRILRSVLPASLPGSMRVSGSALALCAVCVSVLTGCTSSKTSSKVQVESVVFADAKGAAKTTPTAITAGKGSYVEVTLTGDTALLGADWSVYCGSALPVGTPLPVGQTQDESCGTFTPTHTMSGPIPSYATTATGYVAYYTAPTSVPKGGVVTLYASSTSSPTKWSSATLTINAQPISIEFAPPAPSSLAVNGSTSLTAVVSNDSSNGGVNWSVVCGSSACGSFSSTKTATGVASTYTAPFVAPAGGYVVVTAASVSDPNQSVSATITIVPISIAITPSTVSVATNNSTGLIATVLNDAANAGVDWTVACTNSTSPGVCGAITAHTSSGGTATYTAPSLANILVGTSITITASSTADPTKTAVATANTVKGQFVTGVVKAADQGVRGATVSLYAAQNAEQTSDTVTAANAQAVTTAVTDDDGSFTIPYGYTCPSTDTEMYAVANGGNAGGGDNSNLTLVSALGPCGKLDTSRFVVNEATTVASMYSLSGFVGDLAHVGSAKASPASLASAFSTVNDLVNVTTGQLRERTLSAKGEIPVSRINALANIVSVCAATAGSAKDDGSICDQLLSATNPGTKASTRPANTAEAMLELARHATGFTNQVAAFDTLNRLARMSPSYSPISGIDATEWTIPVTYTSAAGTPVATGTNSSASDQAGNIWVRGKDSGAVEFVGAGSSDAMTEALTSIAAQTE